jgi:hypothetical protein
MSMQLDFTPHSWYKGAAISEAYDMDPDRWGRPVWTAYMDGGVLGLITLDAFTLKDIKQQITDFWTIQ